MKKISIIGVGKLGLCLGLNLEKKGFDLIGIDKSQTYVDLLNQKKINSSEPFVAEMLSESKKIKFSTKISESLDSDIIFVVVATPSTSDWKYNHSQIEDVVDELTKLGRQQNRKDLIINCTTFPGYCENLNKRLNHLNYFVSYNPEFIAQGTIIRDQLNADSVLIGQADDYAGDLIEEIYSVLCNTKPVINKMSRTEAEITKISVNCFLTTKISYANMIGDIVKRYGGNPDVVLSAVGSDSRIGSKYLKFGFGFGGPCFPRDNRALAKCAEEVGIDALISKSTDLMNEKHLIYQIEDFIKENPIKENEIFFESVTYKPESTLLEESQQLKFAVSLYEKGYNVVIKDNREEVISQIQNLFKK